MKLSDKQHELIDAYIQHKLKGSALESFERELAENEMMREEVLFRQGIRSVFQVKAVEKVIEETKLDPLLAEANERKVEHPQLESVHDVIQQATSENKTHKKTIIRRLVAVGIAASILLTVWLGNWRGFEEQSLPALAESNFSAPKAVLTYTEPEIERLLHIAFELAGKRSQKVHSVEKANVMETGIFWREIATRIGNEYSDIELEHMYADNCAMQLVRAPKQFDVIATDNLFGDLLSDCAAMLTGSLGMLPSASLGEEKEGRRAALYEPVHGSAPDIAGQGIANPLATILSFAMCLRFSLDMGQIADQIETAVDQVLAKNIRTVDIAADNAAPVSTDQMGTEVCQELERMSA